jgi:hypothetical protein
LRFRGVDTFRKIEDPFSIDQLIAKIEIEPFERIHRQVISSDAVWSDEKEQIRNVIGFSPD